MTAETFPHGALNAISIHRGGGGFPGDCQAETRPVQLVACNQYRECPTRETFRFGEHPSVVDGPGQARGAREAGLTRCQNAGSYTLSRARPLARRAFRTRRPFLVRMRARNPWVRLRCRLLGWKVLFITVTRCADGRSVRQYGRGKERAMVRAGVERCQPSR